MSAGARRSMDQVLSEATFKLAGLTQSAALGNTKVEAAFATLNLCRCSGKALVVLVFDGSQAVPLIDVLRGCHWMDCRRRQFFAFAAQGKTLRESMSLVTTEIEAQRAELDALTASWSKQVWPVPLG